MEHQVDALERLERERAHTGLHEVGGVEQTGQVVEDVLGVALGPEAGDGRRVAWGARAHDGEVLADERVEQRGLADVGGAGEGDVAGAGHGGKV